MDMPKPDLYKIIAKPESLEPSSPDMEIVGVFNSGVTTVVDGGVEKTLFMLRVAESAVEEPDDCVFLPSFDVQNRDDSPFKIELEKVPKNDLLDIVAARRSTCRFARLLDRREQQSNQDGDNRDHHQKFNERESPQETEPRGR